LRLPQNLNGWTLATWVLTAAMALCLFVTFALWTADTFLDAFWFPIAVAVLFLVPGSQIVRWLDLDDAFTLEYVLLSLVLGMVATCSIYAVVTWIGKPFLLWLWIFAALLSLTFGRKTLFARFQRIAIQRAHFLLLLAVFASWLPLYFLSFLFRNLTTAGAGALTFFGLSDIVLHTSIAAELSHSVPPQVPSMAGLPLSYHVGMDLVAAVLNRYTGLAIPDLVVRFCPVLFVSVDVLAVFCVARRLIGSAEAAVAAALLGVLGEDLSFIPGILNWQGRVWNAWYFQAPTVFSLYTVNPMVAAHGLLFTALLCFYRLGLGAHRGWTGAAALCSAALFETKIFIFVQLVLSLSCVGALHLFFRRLVFVKEIIAILIVASPLMWLQLIANEQGGEIVWIWSSGWQNYIEPAFHLMNWPQMLSYPVLATTIYLTLTYGFRVVGVFPFIGSWFPGSCRPFRLLLVFFIVIGAILSLSTKIVPRENYDYYNNAIWFIVASKYVASLFAVVSLAWVWQRANWVSRPIIVVGIGLTAFASTMQFVSHMVRAKGNFPAPVVQTIAFLNQETRSGEVVISAFDQPILLLTKLRLPFYDLYSESFAKRSIVASRREDINNFWASWKLGSVQHDILEKYKVAWIVAAREAQLPLTEGALLERVYANSEFVIYKVRLGCFSAQN
jgi:hypothetical protein